MLIGKLLLMPCLLPLTGVGRREAAAKPTGMYLRRPVNGKRQGISSSVLARST